MPSGCKELGFRVPPVYVQPHRRRHAAPRAAPRRVGRTRGPAGPFRQWPGSRLAGPSATTFRDAARRGSACVWRLGRPADRDHRHRITCSGIFKPADVRRSSRGCTPSQQLPQPQRADGQQQVLDRRGAVLRRYDNWRSWARRYPQTTVRRAMAVAAAAGRRRSPAPGDRERRQTPKGLGDGRRVHAASCAHARRQRPWPGRHGRCVAHA